VGKIGIAMMRRAQKAPEVQERSKALRAAALCNRGLLGDLVVGDCNGGRDGYLHHHAVAAGRIQPNGHA